MTSTVQIVIEAADKASANINKVTGSFDSLTDKLTLAIDPISLASKGFDLLANAAWASINAFADAEVVGAQLDAVLKSTGGAAGMTREQLEYLADSLSKVSGMDDEAILRGEALLLTFRAIGSDVFPKATEAALNMSMAMNQDLQSSIIQVGKALNEPIQGVSALRRVGVQLTDQQEEQIKAFMEVNDIASAQGIILEELEAQFGGVAATMGETVTGSINTLKVSWENLLETLGESGAGGAKGFAETLTEIVDNTNNSITAARDYYEVLERVSAATGMTTRELRKMDEAEVAVYTRGVLMTDFYKAQAEGAANSASAIAGVTAEMQMSEEQVKALSQANAAYLDLVSGITGELDKYAQKETDLQAKHDELIAKKQQLIAQGWSPESDKITEINQKLADNESAMQKNADEFELAGRRKILSMLEQQLAVGGLDAAETNYLLSKGLEWGVYSEQAVAAAKAAQAEVLALTAAFENLPSEKWITIRLQGVEEARAALGALAEANPDRTYQVGGYASGTGGWLTVPPGYNNDSYPVLMSSGEKFAVIPKGGGNPSGYASGTGFGNVVVNLSYSPVMSLGDETELRSRLVPLIISGVKEARAQGVIQ